MNEPEHHAPHMTRQEQSQDKSLKVGDGGSGSSAHSEIHDRTGLYLSVISLILSALALGSMLVMPKIYEAQIALLKENNDKLSQNYRDAETQHQIEIMEIRGFKSALLAHGIKDTNPHLPGEPD
jgi:hypothetical protein